MDIEQLMHVTATVKRTRKRSSRGSPVSLAPAERLDLGVQRVRPLE